MRLNNPTLSGEQHKDSEIKIKSTESLRLCTALGVTAVMASTNGTPSDSSVLLYSGAPSDCSSRLRIALNLKGIPYDLKTLTGAFIPQTPSCLNPAQTVPTLVFQDPSDGKGPLTLTQSIAALEYLEEAYPDSKSLLPKDVRSRAQVRTLVSIIATDIHPLTTHRVRDTIFEHFPAETVIEAKQNGNRKWDYHWIRRGIAVYEKLVAQTAGKYSVGDEVTLADVSLVPELWTGLAMGLELEEFPVVAGIFRRCMEVEAVGRERTH
jgi:maleylacetoacetate isomerase